MLAQHPNGPENGSGMIILAGSTSIGRGTNREIWERPGHPNQILKTMLPHKLDKYKKRSAFRRAIEDMRIGPYIAFRAEYNCYLKTAYKCVQAGRPIPIAEIGGMVLTDRGLAQVCEKVMDRSGGPAKTVGTLLKEKAFDSELLSLLNDFVESLYSLNVNIQDLTYANIALDEIKGRFILIDGYGDRTLIPLNAWIKPLNQREIDHGFAKMAVGGYLEWDAAFRRFELL